MKQQALFEVPKVPKPKRVNHAASIRAIAKKHGIWTHRARHEEFQWSAWLMPHVKSVDEFMAEIASKCRFYDESNRAAYGKTEAEAVINLCVMNQLNDL